MLVEVRKNFFFFFFRNECKSIVSRKITLVKLPSIMKSERDILVLIKVSDGYSQISPAALKNIELTIILYCL